MTVSNAYEPVFSDRTLPTPVGMFGSNIHLCFSPEQQRLEAEKMLEFLKTTPSLEMGQLTLMSSPAPLLMQVPGTNRVV